MENSSEALLMAGAVLLFALALSIAFVSFGQTATTLSNLIINSDRESKTITDVRDVIDANGEIDEEANYYYSNLEENLYSTKNGASIVSIGDVVDTIYRSLYDNTRVQFVFENNMENKHWLDIIPKDDALVSKLVLEYKANTGISSVDQYSLNNYKAVFGNYIDNSNSFESNMLNNLPTEQSAITEYLNYLLYGKYPDRLGDGDDTAQKKAFRRNVVVVTPLLGDDGLINNENLVIEKHFGMYTSGKLENNISNMDENRVVTFVVR